MGLFGKNYVKQAKEDTQKAIDDMSQTKEKAIRRLNQFEESLKELNDLLRDKSDENSSTSKHVVNR